MWYSDSATTSTFTELREKERCNFQHTTRPKIRVPIQGWEVNQKLRELEVESVVGSADSLFNTRFFRVCGVAKAQDSVILRKFETSIVHFNWF